MTLTPLLNTGFEHGILSNAGGYPVNGLSASGYSIISTGQRSGSYAARVTRATSTANWIQLSVKVQQTWISLRFAVKLSSVSLSAKESIFITQNNLSGNNGYLMLDSATGRVLWSFDGSAVAATGPVINDGGWHMIELNFNIGVNPRVLTWRVDKVDQTRVTLATGAGNLMNFALGTAATTASGTYVADYDDVIIGSSTAESEFWGDGRSLAQKAGSDGTHTSAYGDFSPGDAGSLYGSPPTNAYTMVDDMPWSTTRSSTDNLAMRVQGTAQYLEIAPETTTKSGPANSVMSYVAFSSSATSGSNTAGCIVRNSAGTSAVVWGDLPALQGGGGGSLANYVASAQNFKAVQVTKPAGGWTGTEVNSVRWRFGGSGDVSPIPTCQALMLEVDWPTTYFIVAAVATEVETAQAITPHQTYPAQSIAVAQVVESEASSAKVIRAVRVYKPVAVSETDSGLGLSKVVKTVKPVAVTQVQTASSIAINKASAVAKITAPNAATTLTRAKTLLVPKVGVPSDQNAKPLTVIKLFLTTQASESDSGLVVVRSHPIITASVSVAADVESALAIGHHQEFKIDVAAVSETDLLRAIWRAKAKLAEQVLEICSALAVARSKAKPVAQVGSSESSLAVSRRKLRANGVVSESEVAQAIKVIKSVSVAKVAESDTNLAMKTLKTVPTSDCREVEAATLIHRLKTKVAGATTETDSASSLGRVHGVRIIGAGEMDAATLLVKLVKVGRASETSSARVLTQAKTKAITATSEQDASIHIDRKPIPGKIEFTTEFESASVLRAGRRYQIGLASESEQIRPVTAIRQVHINRSSESEQALPILVQKQLYVNQVIETDSAPAFSIHFRHYIGVTAASEVSVAETVTAANIIRVRTAYEADSAGEVREPQVFIEAVLEDDIAHSITALKFNRSRITGYSRPRERVGSGVEAQRSGSAGNVQRTGRSNPKERTDA